MALTSANFKHGDTEFGIFYPTGYVLSVFPDTTRADHAIAALCDAGFRGDDLVVASGMDVLAYSREMRANRGRFSRFGHFVAGLYGDEAELADELVGLAERGHTFVAVHAPEAVPVDLRRCIAELEERRTRSSSATTGSTEVHTSRRGSSPSSCSRSLRGHRARVRS